MHDLVIRGGLIVDGTGAPAFEGDVAIRDGRISAVGKVSGRGREEIDARGRWVTPGFVDLHTHYDGQATWDPWVTPSGWHGVTTVVMGNCGVGFAPCREEDREWLIGVMEGVEDIPGTALVEGMKWAWQSFPEYLDALARIPRAVDVACLVPHAPVRGWVMGRRASEQDDATPEQIAAMREIVVEGMRAGALGFSTSRTSLHKTIEGVLVAGTNARVAELEGISEAFARVGHGVLTLADEHASVPGDLEWMERIARNTGFPVCFNLAQIDQQPRMWEIAAKHLARAAEEGVPLYAQIPGRAIGIVMSWRSTAHPFVLCNTWAGISHLTWEQQRERLRDPAFKEALLKDQPFFLGEFQQFVTRTWAKMFAIDPSFNYEPDPKESLAGRALQEGKRPEELAYDALMRDDGNGLLYFPLFNYSDGDLGVLEKLHHHPHTLLGLSDGGAHCGAITDAGMPTFMLSFWARDRQRGPTWSLERAVKRQTSETAAFYGLNDRGILAPGYRADVNVIDPERLALLPPRLAWDLPAGGRRLIQEARGYVATVVAGRVTARDGVFTGEMPGGLVRGPRGMA